MRVLCLVLAMALVSCASHPVPDNPCPQVKSMIEGQTLTDYTTALISQYKVCAASKK
jgi:hypothetical protein